MKFLIVTGLSGAGKTSVLRHLEDSGYQCMDNMPSPLLRSAFTLCEKVSLKKTSRSGSIPDAVRFLMRRPFWMQLTAVQKAMIFPFCFWKRTTNR